MTFKRIGFVDDDLENFHANTYLEAIRGPLAQRGYQIAGAFGLQEATAAAWCARQQVPLYKSVDALAAEVDYVAILAPSAPECHLELCQRVFPSAKPTFVDKTFAPDVATAGQIFQLADRCGVALQSTSALRTTNVQRAVAALPEPLTAFAAWAGGASFDEYGVHPVELVVSCLGSEVERVYVAGSHQQPTLVLTFAGDRVATIQFNSGVYVPFQTVLTTRQRSEFLEVDDSRLFVDAAAAILDFFDAGRPLVPRDETLAVMRVLQAVRDPASRDRPVRV
jgi:predicted dehydrogenase